MAEIIDASGLACPQPVVLTKKALEKFNEIITIVDNQTALENVKRLANKENCKTKVNTSDNGKWQIHMQKETPVSKQNIVIETSEINGPNVCIIAEDSMGRGDRELGKILIRAYLHTITDPDIRPDIILLYNSGVKLALDDSETLQDLQSLEKSGVEILVCGTCADFLE